LIRFNKRKYKRNKMQLGQLPRKLGLIVGVNSYQDSLFRPLRCAENDAKALAQWLVNTKGGKWNPPDVQLVQGQHATKELVESLLAQLYLQVAETGDEVVFYFAGHAFVDERSGDGYLALANTRYQDTSTAINVRTLIQSTQSQSRAGQTLCIFDCFQTGPVWDTRRASQYDSKALLGTVTLATLQQSANRLCLCSCRGNAFAGETGEGGLGAFVHRLLLGLCGPAVESATGNVALTKLHAYLFSTLPEQHRPQLFGQQTSPFILVGNSVPATTSDAHLSPSHSGSSPVSQGKTSEHSKSGLLKKYAAASSSDAQLPPLPSSSDSSVDQGKTSEHSKGGLLKKYAAASTSDAQLPPLPSPGDSPTDQGGTPEHSTGGLLKKYAAVASGSASASQASSAPTSLLQYAQMDRRDSGDLVSSASNGSLQKAGSDEQKQCKQMLEQARQYMQNQNYKEAFDLVEQVLRMVPNDIAALTLKGQLFGTAGRFAEAMATVEQILQNDPDNALAWSMRAVLLSNMGQQQDALSAIERSLELDAKNPESYGIKTRIMESLAAEQAYSGKRAAKLGMSRRQAMRGVSSESTKDNPRAFLLAAGLQTLGFILGMGGVASTYFLGQTIPYVSLAIACLGLATMCVMAAQGAFYYGFSRLIPTVLFTVLSAAMLGGAYKVLGLTRIIANIQAQIQITPQAAIVRLLTFGIIGIWLAAAALLPLIGGILGLIAGFVMRRTRSSG
jgi:tetratricopeptide (TPR) repeat protein